jgi:hypothetical protein
LLLEEPLGAEGERLRIADGVGVDEIVGDEDAKAVGNELWDEWGGQLEALIDAGRLVPAPEVAALARQLRSLVWGIFNESQLTGELDDPSRRKARAQEVARLLLPNARRSTRRRGTAIGRGRRTARG